MAPEEICHLLESQCGDAIVGTSLDGCRPFVQVAPKRWPEVALVLRDDDRLGFNLLNSITALDLLADDQLACVYDLSRVPIEPLGDLLTEPHTAAVRVVTDRKNPTIPSVASVWMAADWHEREAYDLMGIVFSGHPDHRRILCPDDWVGHPLRKDYEFPLAYHAIPGSTEYDLPNPRH